MHLAVNCSHFLLKVTNFTKVVKTERSGRVLDSRPRGSGFKPHGHHCVVSFSKTDLS